MIIIPGRLVLLTNLFSCFCLGVMFLTWSLNYRKRKICKTYVRSNQMRIKLIGAEEGRNPCREADSLKILRWVADSSNRRAR